VPFHANTGNNLLVDENKRFISITSVVLQGIIYYNTEKFAPIFQKWALPLIFGESGAIQAAASRSVRVFSSPCS
jgi:hypothetical protein